VTFLRPETRTAIELLLAADDAAATSPLDRVRGIRSLTALLENEPALLTSVRAAKRDHESWDAIADAAGLKPAAAKWRWQGNDAEIAERHDQGRKRAARPSSVPTDLPGLSVADAATKLGVSAQAIYLQVTRGTLHAETVTLDDGRSYKRVFPEDGFAARPVAAPKVSKDDLPGRSVTEVAAARGVSSQAVYQLIARGKLRAETISANGHSYKRVFDDLDTADLDTKE
jgi:predicted DNA-binding protein YlxM (UPF0122 family)